VPLTKHLFRKTAAKTIGCRYLAFLPAGYEAGRKCWPLILFLHGSRERGSNVELVKRHGLPKIVEQQPDFPFIVIAPQLPAREWWSPEILGGLLDEVQRKYRVDATRIYVTGLSMGGYGTWQLAVAHPHRFAAIAPICAGGANFHRAPEIAHVPAWVFHGARDKVVAISESREWVRRLRQAGGRPKFTIYPRAEHDSWTQAYDDPRLYRWFLQHRRAT
jgi:predicted peptidase